MKDVRGIIFGVTVGLAVLFPPWTYVGFGHFGKAYAQVLGTVTFAGTFAPNTVADGARARVRIEQVIGSQCAGIDAMTLWVIISSGNLNNSAGVELNSLNMKNAYSTLLTALLSGKTVQIDGVRSCSRNVNGEVFLDLPNGNVSVF
jgi:hypothetical protein